ncbi:KEOPS complex subunit Pcc1 [Methanolacinia paynteri]|uniref:KEOPS complex subunit Pcc1 n=1 Tax=Methanolacinia paynteri TaxID=230356 RepID=UPI000694C04E|nr:KEOPS complex subunit Pcc1 [Methanolacinia paynteri]
MSSPLKMPYEAVFEFETPVAVRIFESVVPESEDMGRSFASVKLEGENRISLFVQAEDVSALRAALNTWLRLINIADEMQEVVNP